MFFLEAGYEEIVWVESLTLAKFPVLFDLQILLPTSLGAGKLGDFLRKEVELVNGLKEVL
jgi:hypothetical protein